MVVITKFDLMDIVRDKVTGYEGVIIAIKQELESVLLYLIQPQGLDGEGYIKEGYWLPGSRLDLIEQLEPTDIKQKVRNGKNETKR